MMDRLIAVVQFVFGFAVLAGLVVLWAALQSTHDERNTSSPCCAPWAPATGSCAIPCWRNFAVLGVIAGVLAGAGATAIGWVLGRGVQARRLCARGPAMFSVRRFGLGVVLAVGWGTRALLVGAAGEPARARPRALWHDAHTRGPCQKSLPKPHPATAAMVVFTSPASPRWRCWCLLALPGCC